MNRTHHFQQRMDQRNYSEYMLLTILGLGEWNERGDRISIDSSQDDDVKSAIMQARRKQKEWRKIECQLERLRKRGKSTIVMEDNSLITIYQDR